MAEKCSAGHCVTIRDMNYRRLFVILGVLNIVVGVLGLCINASDAFAGFAGPAMVRQQMQTQDTPEYIRKTNELTIEALEHRGYRAFMAVEGLLGGLMALVLIVSGIGMLTRQRLAYRMALIWCGYGIVAAVINSVMLAIFRLPEMLEAQSQPSSPVMVWGLAIFLMLFLWIYPVTIGLLLMWPGTRAYARSLGTQWSDVRSAVQGLVPAGRGGEDLGTQMAGDDVDQPGPIAEHQTYRDDPWNDPTAT